MCYMSTTRIEAPYSERMNYLVRCLSTFQQELDNLHVWWMSGQDKEKLKKTVIAACAGNETNEKYVNEILKRAKNSEVIRQCAISAEFVNSDDFDREFSSLQNRYICGQIELAQLKQELKDSGNLVDLELFEKQTNIAMRISKISVIQSDISRMGITEGTFVIPTDDSLNPLSSRSGQALVMAHGNPQFRNQGHGLDASDVRREKINLCVANRLSILCVKVPEPQNISRETLADSYKTVLDSANNFALPKIIFPALGTGIGHLNPRDAAKSAINTINKFFTEKEDGNLVDDVKIVVFDKDPNRDIIKRALYDAKKELFIVELGLEPQLITGMQQARSGIVRQRFLHV